MSERSIQLPSQNEPPQAQDFEVFDSAALMRHVGNDRELLQDIVELFLETAPQLLRDIREAADCVNGNHLKTAAHALRGAARNFYAPGVEQAALALEEMGQGQNLADAHAACDVLEAELATLRPLLHAMLRDESSEVAL